MRKLKVSLAVAAIVLGIGSAFATSGNVLLEKCKGNVQPTECQGGDIACCYINTPQGQVTFFRELAPQK
ncbi:DUF6520 family protein [Solitalea lacus]|uniref:DUF6520 family protein n=1 Tax=Solitalea lacus TaxID=2911172 RepID=UPI001EDBEB58|nr:DUF6520 family protein [Solitalea lacus]UKJ09216.1 DUF6520 family protein [Solitalea lacus]